MQRSSKITRKLVKSGSGGEVYARIEMGDHMALKRDVYEPFYGLAPGVAGQEACEGLFTHFETKKTPRSILPGTF